MISFQEQCEVYHSRYTLSAPEVRQNAKLDREILNNKEDRHNLGSKESYNNWLDGLENS